MVTSGPLTIRLAGRSDIGAVDALLGRSYPRLLKADYPPSVLVTALPLITRAQPDLLTSGSYFLGEADGQVVVAGGWTMGAPGSGRGVRGIGHVRHVASDPDHLRKGYARALMDHVMIHAKGSGMNMLHCLSTRTAVPFYTALGFVSEGERMVEMRQGIRFPSIAMSRPL